MAQPHHHKSSICLAGFLILLTIRATSAIGDEVDYAWRFDDKGDGPFLLLGSAEPMDDFIFLVSCNDDRSRSDMVVYRTGGARVGEPLIIELSHHGAKVLLRAIATADKRGFVFAEAKNFPVKPLISVLDGQGPVRMTTGKTITVLPEKGRAAGVAAFGTMQSELASDRNVPLISHPGVRYQPQGLSGHFVARRRSEAGSPARLQAGSFRHRL